jgi:hypothetical protein
MPVEVGGFGGWGRGRGRGGAGGELRRRRRIWDGVRFDMAAPFHGERCAGRCGVNCGNPSPPAPLSPPLPPSAWPRAPLNLVARRANLASMSRREWVPMGVCVRPDFVGFPGRSARLVALIRCDLVGAVLTV